MLIGINMRPILALVFFLILLVELETKFSRRFLTQENPYTTPIFLKISKLLQSLEGAKTYLKSLGGYDKAY